MNGDRPGPIHHVTRYFITSKPSSRSLGTRATPQSNRPHDNFPDTAAEDRVRFVCVSDTHSTGNWQAEMPSGDVLIHAGDLTRAGTRQQILQVYQELKDLPFEIKLVIAGNHDLGLDPIFLKKHRDEMESLGMDIADNIDDLRAMWKSEDAKASGIVFLEHESTQITIRGRQFSVFGSPYTSEFFDWAFMYPAKHDIWSGKVRDQLYHSAVEPVDILITHGPPKGWLDEVNGVGSVGCPFLTKRLATVQPKLHVFGHIHEGADVGLLRHRFGKIQETILVNASLLDEKYRLVHRPTVVDL